MVLFTFSQTESFINENGVGTSSPGWQYRFEKLTDCFSIRGGVPVFILPVLNPNRFKVLARPIEEMQLILPPGLTFIPLNIRPFKNVPVVSTTHLVFNNVPFSEN